jgi:speckle-type POZ protein
MEHGRTNLTEAVRSVQLLKIDGYCTISTMTYSEFIKSRWSVDGHEWEVHLYPKYCPVKTYGRVAVKLILLSEPQRSNSKLRANLSCRLVNPTRELAPVLGTVSHVFESRGECPSVVYLVATDKLPSSGFLNNDSLTVECTLTVLKELRDVVLARENMEGPLPPSDLHQHLGDLLQAQRGADVTFVLESGECFPAHKTILAARSPVFMAEFFGHMNERRSQSVRIQDMQAAVFKAMLHFIYTDKAPELEEDPESTSVAAMAQHLLAAADR